MSVDLVSMADELERNRMLLLALRNGAANETLQLCRQDNRHHITDLKMRTIQKQLTNIQLDVIAFPSHWNETL